MLFINENTTDFFCREIEGEFVSAQGICYGVWDGVAAN